MVLMFLISLFFFFCANISHVFTNMYVFLFVLLGGVFKLELFLPEEYPMAAPKVINLILLFFFGIMIFFRFQVYAEFFST